jgi:hypothetical protein
MLFGAARKIGQKSNLFTAHAFGTLLENEMIFLGDDNGQGSKMK